MNISEKQLKNIFLETEHFSWQTVKFGDVVKEVKESCSNPETRGIDKVVGLEHLVPHDIHIRDWKSTSDSTTFTKLFRKGQVLFARRRAYQRKAALAEFDGICSGDIIVMEAVASKLNPRLLPYLVHSDRFFEWAVSTSAGSLSPRTKFKYLAELEFKLPTLDEQEKICEILESFENLESKYYSLVLDLKIAEATLANKLIQKPDKEYVSLGELITIEKGLSYSAGDILENEGLPMINLNSFEKHGGFNVEGIKYYNGEYKEKNIVKEGDIIIAVTDITRNGDVIGYPVIVPNLEKTTLISMDCCKLSVDEKVIKSSFLYFLLKTEWVHRHMYSHSRGTTVLHLDVKGISKLKIKKSSLKEQEEISKKLLKSEKSIKEASRALYKVQEVKQTLINHIL